VLRNKKGPYLGKSDNTVLALAPSFEVKEEYGGGDFARESFRPLKWANKEIESLSNYFGGENFIGEKATESAFSENASIHDVIHIASHALVNDKEPMLSKIAFSFDANDTLNDGFLHTFELYAKKLKAKLAVLSACNTGYGKIQKGEGVLSLGYAFLHAGVPSVVMSHWQVDDKSSYLLMERFYKYLADGLNKSQALRKAKLELIENNNIAYANPYYWGAFISLGNDDAIVSPKPNYAYGLLSVFPFLIIFILISFKQQKNGLSKKSRTELGQLFD